MTAVGPALLVGLGGAGGAVARHLVGEAVDAEGVPAATLTVNALGSLALGYLTFAGVGGDLALLLGTGACGAFTTFSSFSVETVDRWEGGDPLLAIGYALGTLAVCLLAVGLGARLAT